jgi:hypothetical protein
MVWNKQILYHHHFPSEHVIRKQEQLEMNQLLLYAGDVNLLGKNINTIKESIETVLLTVRKFTCK